jgi:uncharacterized protein YjbI with pentapeptide repeats
MKAGNKERKFVFKRDKPDLPAQLPILRGASWVFEDRDISVTEHHIVDVVTEGRNGSLRAEACVLEAINLSGSVLNSLIFKDVRLIRCDLANLEARRMNLVRTEFVDCRMTGMRAVDSGWENTLIERGDQRYAQLRFSRFESAEFEDCNFSEADFEGSDLSGSIFRRCKLERAEMSKAKLANADLRGSRIEGVQLDPPAVRGALVDAAQAITLAGLLGVRIG